MTQSRPSTLRSTIINIGGAVIPAALMLVTVPIYIHLIGASRYGVLTIVWLLLGYFGVFDLGFGRAVANRIAALHDVAPEQRETVFWTGLALSIVTSLVGGLLLYLIAKALFISVFHVDHALRDEVERAIPWMILALPLTIVISLLSGALEGRQEFLSLTVSRIIGTAFFQIIPLVVAYSGYKTLPNLIPAVLLSRAFTIIILFTYCFKKLPLGAQPRFSRSEVRSLLEFGSWITLTGIVSPLLTVIDRFIISTKLGMLYVTAYTIPSNLGNYIGIIPSSLQLALFPRFAMASREEGRCIVRRFTLLLSALMSPIVIIAILSLKPFLAVWIGGSLSDMATPVGQILFLGVWINTLAFIPYAYLQGIGRPDIVAKFHLLELFPYGIVLWLLIDFLGIRGVAWAWTFRVMADALLLYYASGALSSLLRAWLPGTLVILAFFLSTNVPNILSVDYLLPALLLVATGIALAERSSRSQGVNAFQIIVAKFSPKNATSEGDNG